MDRRCINMKNTNMEKPAILLETVPTYALYGERRRPLLPERLHCESIARRSHAYGWEIQPHRHDLFVQILYVRAGSGGARLDQSELALQPPCMLWIPEWLPHGFHFSHDIDGDVITVVAQHARQLMAGVPELLARLEQPLCLRLHPATGDPAQALRVALDALLAEIGTHDAGRLPAIQSALLLALLRIARMADAGCTAGPSGVTRGDRHLRRFAALIDRHFREQPALAFYAERLGITTTQLNRVCRQQAGVTALAMIQQRLMHEAERDLVYGTRSVKEIALNLGFSDAGYFSRFFSRQVGQPPSEFRDSAWRRLREADATGADGVSAAADAALRPAG